MIREVFDKDCFLIATNKSDVLHIVSYNKGQNFSTGQPYYEVFDSMEDLQYRVVSLGFDLRDYFEEDEILIPIDENNEGE